MALTPKLSHLFGGHHIRSILVHGHNLPVNVLGFRVLYLQESDNSVYLFRRPLLQLGRRAGAALPALVKIPAGPRTDVRHTNNLLQPLVSQQLNTETYCLTPSYVVSPAELNKHVHSHEKMQQNFKINIGVVTLGHHPQTSG
jgi:hypothetical protein